MSDFCPVTFQGNCKFCGKHVASSAGCDCQRVRVAVTATPASEFECCPDWKPQCEIVNGPIVLQSIRSGGAYTYPGKRFTFCPWCGTRRPL